MTQWNDHAAGWDNRPGVQDYADRAFAALIDTVGPLTGWADWRVLDFGCGTGLLSGRIAPHVSAIIGLDISASMINVAAAKRVPNHRAFCADIVSGPVPPQIASGGFDLIVASSVCGFVADYPACVRRLAGLLAPGGVFVQWDWQADPVIGETDGLTADQIRQAQMAAGLVDVSVATAFSMTMGVTAMPVLQGHGTAPRPKG